MPVNIAETRIPITLGGVKREMVFNANSMCAFEDQTGKFFLTTVNDLFEAIFPEGVPQGKDIKDAKMINNPLRLIEKVPITTLRALLWCTLHEYDDKDNPHWPLTINQVGRLMGLTDILPIFNLFMRGQSGNSPSRDELGESPAEDKTQSPSVLPHPTAEAGGEPGISLPVGAFD